MSDLISRSALIERMNDTKIQIMLDLPVEELLGEDVDMDDFCTLLQDAIQAYRKLVIGEVITNAPTVDAVPVRGEWIVGSKPRCSICGKPALREYDRDDWLSYVPSNFCPNCGADMRKKVE